MMNRRNLFKSLLAALFAVPAVAQGLKKQEREPLGIKEEPHYIRYLYIEIDQFDGWDIKKQYFKIKAHRFPVGTAENHHWEYSIPYKILHCANFIQVVPRGDEKPLVLMDRRGRHRPRDPIEIYYVPLRDDAWLIENNYRYGYNESYTSIGEATDA